MTIALDSLRAAFAGRLTIERLLAEGGMSRVYIAHDPGLNRPVALKLLREELAAGLAGDRFEREIRIAATLQHPHVVPLLSAGVLPDFFGPGRPAHWYTMPLVDGESLRARLARAGPLAVPDAVAILRDVGRALAFAHAHGVIHRDIKPDNVLLTGTSAQVTDFGIAKALDAATTSGIWATTTGLAVGTPAYMAPEQAAADPAVDHRADLYALGALGYEMLTGSAPFSGSTPAILLAAVATQSPPPLRARRPEVPPGLAALLERALAKLPEQRPESAEAFLADLEHGVTRPEIARGAVRRRLLPGAAAGLGLLLFAAVFVWRRTPAERQVRLAVLPFEERGCPADVRLADGLSDELTARLVRVSGLNVVARTSALRFRSSGKTAPQFGEDLNAEYVLDGSVACGAADGRVRIIPALVRVRDEAQVWGEPQEADRADVFRLQADLAERVAVALQGRLVPAERDAVRRATTSDLGAYDAYVLGLFYFRQRGPALRHAVTYFSKAVALDPAYARAWAGLAMAYAVNPLWRMPGITLEQSSDSAAIAAGRALELDSLSAEARAAIGLVRLYRFQWPEAEGSLRQAIALDPSFTQAYQWLSEVLTIQGRAADALSAARSAVALEPLSAVAIGVLGYAHVANRDLDSAALYHARAAAIDTTDAMNQLWERALALTLWYQGRRSTALEHWSQSGLSPAYARLWALALDSGQRSQLAALADSLVRSPDHDIGLVVLLPQLGREQQGLRVLEGLVRAPRGVAVSVFLMHPYLHDAFRGLPEYATFRRRFNLPP